LLDGAKKRVGDERHRQRQVKLSRWLLIAGPGVWLGSTAVIFSNRKKFTVSPEVWVRGKTERIHPQVTLLVGGPRSPVARMCVIKTEIAQAQGFVIRPAHEQIKVESLRLDRRFRRQQRPAR